MLGALRRVEGLGNCLRSCFNCLRVVLRDYFHKEHLNTRVENQFTVTEPTKKTCFCCLMILVERITFPGVVTALLFSGDGGK